MQEKTLKARKYPRLRLTDTFVVSQQGACRVFDLSPGGVSFGCTSERRIPEILTVDIVDNMGLHLLDLPLKTIWAAKNKDLCTSSIYEVIVGAKFENDLSPEQQAALNQILHFLEDSSVSNAS